jgi:hypothetical protein
MKGTFLRKIAAVGTGLALVAGSVVAAVNWSDMVDETNKTMKVSGIVVGANADPMDSTAAGNLAAALASKYSYDKETKVNDPICTTGSVFAGDSQEYDDLNLAVGTVSEEVSYTKLDALTYESSMSYKVGGSTSTTSAKESLSFGGSVSFDDDPDVQRLNYEVDNGDLTYTLTFGTGIDFETDSFKDSGSSDKVEIPFLGKTYVVNSIDDSTLELFEKNAVSVYSIGDTINGLKGKDGKEYHVNIENIAVSGSTTETVILSLYDSTTNQLVDDYAHDRLNVTDDFAEDFLESKIYVKDIYDTSSNSDLKEWNVELAVGKEALTIKNNGGFPYDSTISSTSKYNWEASYDFDSTDENTLKSITVTNTSKYEFKDEDGLAPGDDVEFPGGMAALKFIGLQLPEFEPTDAQETYALRLGNDSITYIDDDETTHEIPFYLELSLSEGLENDDSNYNYMVDSFEFDGLDYSLKIAIDENNVMTVELYNSEYPSDDYADSNINDFNLDAGYASTSNLVLFDSEDTKIEYKVIYSAEEPDEMYLVFADTSVDVMSGSFGIVGTATGEDADYADYAYYVPNMSEFETTYEYDFNSGDASVAEFTVTDGYEDINVYIDTETGDYVTYDDDDAHAGYQAATSTLELEDGKDDGLTEFYTNFGTKVYLDNSEVVLELPENWAFAEVQVVGASGSGEETCVDNFTTKMVKTPYAGMPSVMKDTAAGTGNYIVVGGYFVNSLFAEVAADATAAASVFGEALAQAGDKVTKVINGSLYVAGYTKEDTMDAVDALIDELNL